MANTSTAPTAWLSGLTPEEERLVRSRSSSRSFERGETIFAPASHPRSVYVLEKGVVRIYRIDPSGGELTLGYVAPGEVFGELVAFGDHPRDSFAAAALPSRVRKFERRAFERLVKASPARVVAVTHQIAERLKRTEDRVEHMVFDDVRSRLVSMLLELAHDFGELEEAGVRIRLPLSQSELATLVGATRQTVNETLAKLREAGLLGRDGPAGLVLPDVGALRAALERGPETPPAEAGAA